MNDQTASGTSRAACQSRFWWLRPLANSVFLFTSLVLAVVVLGAAQRLGWISNSGSGSSEVASADKDAVYTCPMDPQIRQPNPGRCPICGMELVVASAGGGDVGEMSIQIDPAARRVANITTAPVERIALERTIRTVGAITYDESRLATISAYVNGRVEKLFADYTGVRVREGDHIAILYSPKLYVTHMELLEAKRALSQSSNETLTRVRGIRRGLHVSAREKLIELGMTKEQVQQLEGADRPQNRMPICAPLGGTVIEKLAVEGQYLKQGDPIYRIADLSVVWLMLELFPEDAAFIRYGQAVKAEVQSLPGRAFIGHVVFVDPMVNPKTRTIGVRVEISNEHGLLRPGDYATGTIRVPLGPDLAVNDAPMLGRHGGPEHAQSMKDHSYVRSNSETVLLPASQVGFVPKPVSRPGCLVVPSDAVLSVGESSVLYVETKPGTFEIRQVTLGPITGAYAVIVDGVCEGEQVALSGNFLIDSQMQLAGKPSVIDPQRAKAKKPGPLELEKVEAQRFAGQTGRDLERLYQSYFVAQAALVADTPVSSLQTEALRTDAESLLKSVEVPGDLKRLLEAVVDNTTQFGHKDLKPDRDAFKAVSHAVIRLAARARGAEGAQPFLHFYCPMVEGGGGDWLQAADPLANPYFGSRMLRCGKKMRQLPLGDLAPPSREQGLTPPTGKLDVVRRLRQPENSLEGSGHKKTLK